MEITCLKCSDDEHLSLYEEEGGGLQFDIALCDLIAKPAQVTEKIMLSFFAKEIVEEGLFHDLQQQLEHNVFALSGIDRENIHDAKRKPVMPTKNEQYVPSDIPRLYLQYTPLEDFFGCNTPVTVTQSARFEHTHVLGGTGHGKTQLLQYLIHHDIYEAGDTKLSIVVIDSQGDMIRKLSRMDVLSPALENPLSERLIIIDPSDVEHPPALNLFDAGLDRLDEYTHRASGNWRSIPWWIFMAASLGHS